MSHFSKILKDDEELVRLVRRHPLTFFGSILISLFFLLLPFFLMVLLLSWKTLGLILFLFFLLVGIILVSRFLTIRYYNCLMITSQRVILFRQKGLFDRQVSEIEYQKIQDVSYHFKGLWQTLWHYGSLKIQVLSSETVIKAEKIPQPEKVQDLIKNIQRNLLLESQDTLKSNSQLKLKPQSNHKPIPGVDGAFKKFN